jgi:hypothetical protein
MTKVFTPLPPVRFSTSLKASPFTVPALGPMIAQATVLLSLGEGPITVSVPRPPFHLVAMTPCCRHRQNLPIRQICAWPGKSFLARMSALSSKFRMMRKRQRLHLLPGSMSSSKRGRRPGLRCLMRMAPWQFPRSRGPNGPASGRSECWCITSGKAREL